MVFLHGGYWIRNGRENFAIIAEGAQACGWSAALPGYTLAPEASLTEIVAEIGAALDWFAAHRAAHGIAGPVVLSGWSAGGHLVAQWLGHPVVTAGLAVSSVFELAHIRDTVLNEKLNLTETEIAALSPLHQPPVMKPLTIAYGSKELMALVNDSRNLYVARLAAGAPGFLMTVMGADHFSILDEYKGPSGQLWGAARRLVLG
jgi:acetyl esterase/lipase